MDGVTTRYTLNGTQVLAQQTGTDAPIYFTYDASGRPYSMTCGGTTVYYLCNLSGDVFALLDADGNRIVEYTYGPFGQLLEVYGTAAATLGAINPLRYRGYYYDTETGLYYLNSRHYDPEVGRFINADGVIDPTSVLGTNLYAYCGNNPVMRVDSNGHSWEPALKCIFAITITAVAIAALSAFVVFSGGSGALVVAGMAPQIISAVTYTAAAVGAVAEAVAITGAVTYTTVAVVSEAENIVQAAEHTKNKRPSTKNKHQKGQTRKQRDKLGEKGDARRKNPWGRHRLMMY